MPVIEAGHAEGGEVLSFSFGLPPFATADVEIEAVVGRIVLVEVGLADGHEVPFAKEPGGVSGGLQGFGQEDAFMVDARFPLWDEELGVLSVVSGDPVSEVEARRVAPGEDGGPTGRTNSAGGVAVGEEHAVFGEPVDVWGFVEGGPVAAEIAPAEVIDEEEDEIGFLFSQ